MKTIHIDFNDSAVGTLGRAGEHNNTEIVFTLTSELADCDLISAEICTANGEKIPVEGKRNEESSTFTVKLTRQLTVEGSLTLQLVGCVLQEDSDEPQIIAKSPVICGVIAQSINGMQTEADSNPTLLERIWAKVERFHKHNNLSLLDKLTEKIFKLLTDGAMVGSIKTTENDDGVNVLRLKLLRQETDPNKAAFIDLPVFGVQDIYLEDDDSFGVSLDIGLNHYRPVPQINAAPGDNGITEINPNQLYVFGEVEKLHIVFKSGNTDYVNSFYFTFVARDMTMFTLPEEVKWGNDNEIVIEGGKQYEVSIVNNVALWSSAAVEAEAVE